MKVEMSEAPNQQLNARHVSGNVRYRTEDKKEDTQQTAENVVEWAIRTMGESVNDEYGGINAVATDTCNDMRAVWRIVGNDPRTLQVFCVPCDSHGLQILIQDILCKIEPVRRVRLAAEHIVASFHHAPLQGKTS
jgi:hypothetical protein